MRELSPDTNKRLFIDTSSFCTVIPATYRLEFKDKSPVNVAVAEVLKELSAVLTYSVVATFRELSEFIGVGTVKYPFMFTLPLSETSPFTNNLEFIVTLPF